jgi:hypothetical protein
MVSRGPPPGKEGRREDDDDESRRWRKLEKGMEPATNYADEEPFFNDTKFAIDLPRSTFRKFKMLARPSTSRRIMKWTRTQA